MGQKHKQAANLGSGLGDEATRGAPAHGDRRLAVALKLRRKVDAHREGRIRRDDGGRGRGRGDGRVAPHGAVPIALRAHPVQHAARIELSGRYDGAIRTDAGRGRKATPHTVSRVAKRVELVRLPQRQACQTIRTERGRAGLVVVVAGIRRLEDTAHTACATLRGRKRRHWQRRARDGQA